MGETYGTADELADNPFWWFIHETLWEAEFEE
jgi:hypothetical protein